MIRGTELATHSAMQVDQAARATRAAPGYGARFPGDIWGKRSRAVRVTRSAKRIDRQEEPADGTGETGTGELADDDLEMGAIGLWSPSSEARRDHPQAQA